MAWRRGGGGERADNPTDANNFMCSILQGCDIKVQWKHARGQGN